MQPVLPFACILHHKSFEYMDSQETVGQRFVQLIAHLGISKNAFAISLGKTATVIQHLVDERNKPGFDLLDKVFEVYPNVSTDWMMKGIGPMLKANETKPESVKSEVPPTPVPGKKPAAPKPTSIPAAEKAPSTATVTEKPAPAEEQPAPVATPAPAAAIPEPAVAPVPAPTVAPVAAPIVAAEATAPAADTSWQTALYTQQMAHQLALAELRNQHLQDQQRLMQQMMDLMQRQLAR
ncbi:hypothetical protein J0X19_07715 [Hymenobacter sp. BT186]|uniref:XRE family transcriptional regulator n=1 Tax=Hymenobacter telluris TaxID=2816474 RepID=A0A939EVB9_9BACT|nr:hypothetical protein [Hymenobacter telluris]MBO0357829.1 hypothetical protein [Hymenobacter telluris]MBW3373856.1 hypothetical protein [Hymenobacter norwichensis]